MGRILILVVLFLFSGCVSVLWATPPKKILVHGVEGKNYPEMLVHVTFLTAEKRDVVHIDDIEVLENGNPVSTFDLKPLQEISPGIAWAFILDTHLEPNGREAFENYLIEFLSGTGKNDQFALNLLGEQSGLQTFGEASFTADSAKLIEKLRANRSLLENKLVFDAIDETLLVFDSQSGIPDNRAIVVFTDGVDSGKQKKSLEIVNRLRALHQKIVPPPIFFLEPSVPNIEDRTYRLALDQISKASKGRSFEMEYFSLQLALQTIQDHLRSRFVIQYHSDSPKGVKNDVIIRKKALPLSEDSTEYLIGEAKDVSNSGDSSAPPPEPVSSSVKQTDDFTLLVLSLGAIVLLFLGGLFWVRRQKQKSEISLEESEVVSPEIVPFQPIEAAPLLHSNNSIIQEKKEGVASLKEHSHRFYMENSSLRGVATLQIINGEGKGVLFTIPIDFEKLSIGSLDNPNVNQLVLSAPTVSRTHAIITNNKSSFLIENLSKTNPLKINGQTMQRAILKSTDKLEVGTVVLEFIKF